MNVDLSGKAIEARLRKTSHLAGSLRPEARLETKLDMSGTAVANRLRTVSDLLDLCLALARKKKPSGPV